MNKHQALQELKRQLAIAEKGFAEHSKKAEMNPKQYDRIAGFGQGKVQAYRNAIRILESIE